MIKKVSFSGEEKNIQDLYNYYLVVDHSLSYYKTVIKNGSTTNPLFQLMSIDEIEEYFENLKDEIETLFIFDFISSTEASIRIDFYQRVYRKGKDELSKKYREIYKSKENFVRLEEDILKSWKSIDVKAKSEISEFDAILNLRHWISHGRYWTKKIGQEYSILNAFDVCNNIFSKI